MRDARWVAARNVADGDPIQQGPIASCPEPAPQPGVRSAIFDPSADGAANAGAVAMSLLKWALIFFLVSVVAGILGFTGISAASADVARFLFYVFVVIFLILLILGLTIFRV
jgi:uncharacterized membrane protein YtjA (UPF0391 family)